MQVKQFISYAYTQARRLLPAKLVLSQTAQPSADIKATPYLFPCDETLEQVPTLSALCAYAEHEATETLRRQTNILLQHSLAQLQAHAAVVPPELKLPDLQITDVINSRYLFTITEHSAYCYLPASARFCLSRCRDLLLALRKALPCSDEYFDTALMPPICSLAQNVLILPASEGFHDACACGLLRHSLLTAVNAVAKLKQRGLPEQTQMLSFCVNLVLQALCHDIGKVVTDVTISTDTGQHFDPSAMTLQQFVVRSASKLIYVDFKRGRLIAHRAETSPALTTSIAQLRQRIIQACPVDTTHLSCDAATVKLTQTLIREADSNAVCVAKGELKHFIDAPTFAIGTIISLLERINFSGQALTYGVVFTQHGLLLARWSPLFTELTRRFNTVFYDEYQDNNYSRFKLYAALRTSGIAKVQRLHKLIMWHQLELGLERWYLDGIVLELPQNYTQKFSCCHTLISSKIPAEVEPLLEEQQQRLPDGTALVLSVPALALAGSPEPRQLLKAKPKLCPLTPDAQLVTYFLDPAAYQARSASTTFCRRLSAQALCRSLKPLTVTSIAALHDAPDTVNDASVDMQSNNATPTDTPSDKSGAEMTAA